MNVTSCHTAKRKTRTFCGEKWEHSFARAVVAMWNSSASCAACSIGARCLDTGSERERVRPMRLSGIVYGWNDAASMHAAAWHCAKVRTLYSKRLSRNRMNSNVAQAKRKHTITRVVASARHAHAVDALSATNNAMWVEYSNIYPCRKYCAVSRSLNGKPGIDGNQNSAPPRRRKSFASGELL